MLSKSTCTRFLAVYGSRLEQYNTVSSVYKCMVECDTTLIISFINTMNSSGPNVEPCGTPHTIG